MARIVKPAWNWENDYEHMNFRERSENLNYRTIYKVLGVDWDEEFPVGEDPEMLIENWLFIYCDQAFGIPTPKQSERRAVIEELAKRARELSEAIQNTGKRSEQMLDYCLSKALTDKMLKGSNGVLKDQAIDLSDTESETRPTVDQFWEFFESVPAFALQLEQALEALPTIPDETPKGRKPKAALHDVLLNLAHTFERFTGHPAYWGFSIDNNGIATNSFMSFLDETLLIYDPELGKNKAALGSLVRRLLAPK